MLSRLTRNVQSQFAMVTSRIVLVSPATGIVDQDIQPPVMRGGDAIAQASTAGSSAMSQA